MMTDDTDINTFIITTFIILKIMISEHLASTEKGRERERALETQRCTYRVHGG
jgi:hypothetical protein